MVLAKDMWFQFGRSQAVSGAVIHPKTYPQVVIVTACALFFFFFLLIVCFTSYFVFSIAVLPHSPGVVYYHLLLRRETRIPGIAPFSLQIGIWDLFVHRTEILYTHSLWEVVDHSRSKMHDTCLIIIHDPGPESNRGPLD